MSGEGTPNRGDRGFHSFLGIVGWLILLAVIGGGVLFFVLYFMGS